MAWIHSYDTLPKVGDVVKNIIISETQDNYMTLRVDFGDGKRCIITVYADEFSHDAIMDAAKNKNLKINVP